MHLFELPRDTLHVVIHHVAGYGLGLRVRKTLEFYEDSEGEEERDPEADALYERFKHDMVPGDDDEDGDPTLTKARLDAHDAQWDDEDEYYEEDGNPDMVDDMSGYEACTWVEARRVGGRDMCHALASLCAVCKLAHGTCGVWLVETCGSIRQWIEADEQGSYGRAMLRALPVPFGDICGPCAPWMELSTLDWLARASIHGVRAQWLSEEAVASDAARLDEKLERMDIWWVIDEERAVMCLYDFDFGKHPIRELWGEQSADPSAVMVIECEGLSLFEHVEELVTGGHMPVPDMHRGGGRTPGGCRFSAVEDVFNFPLLPDLPGQRWHAGIGMSPRRVLTQMTARLPLTGQGLDRYFAMHFYFEACRMKITCGAPDGQYWGMMLDAVQLERLSCVAQHGYMREFDKSYEESMVSQFLDKRAPISWRDSPELREKYGPYVRYVGLPWACDPTFTC
mmetsp:Transcript_10516/g.26038  ORF Transcript_10516/g.26038 Transcript_10516/m.26038 type:complete len:453 (-) Transcript_10516:752-2110(-)